MKNNILILTIYLILAVSCEKQIDLLEQNCIEQTINRGWDTEDFKANYTIQFPNNDEGGMTNFEGNLFDKNREDDKIHLLYDFCGPLFCADFGGGLDYPFLNTVKVKDENGNELLLGLSLEFCLNDEPTAIFYYNNEENATGRTMKKMQQEDCIWKKKAFI